MSTQMFTDPEANKQWGAWAAPRQMPARVNAPKAQAEFSAGTMDQTTRTESGTDEDWAGDCLFDCYND